MHLFIFLFYCLIKPPTPNVYAFMLYKSNLLPIYPKLNMGFCNWAAYLSYLRLLLSLLISLQPTVSTIALNKHLNEVAKPLHLAHWKVDDYMEQGLQ